MGCASSKGAVLPGATKPPSGPGPEAATTATTAPATLPATVPSPASSPLPRAEPGTTAPLLRIDTSALPASAGDAESLPDRVQGFQAALDHALVSLRDTATKEVRVARSELEALLGGLRELMEDPELVGVVQAHRSSTSYLQRLRRLQSGAEGDGHHADRDLANFIITAFVPPEQANRARAAAGEAVDADTVDVDLGIPTAAAKFKQGVTAVDRMLSAGSAFQERVALRQRLQLRASIAGLTHVQAADRAEVQRLAEDIGRWDWDAIRLASLLHEETLPFLATTILRRHGFLESASADALPDAPSAAAGGGGGGGGGGGAGGAGGGGETAPLVSMPSTTAGATAGPPPLKINATKAWPFFLALARGYRAANPYHNATHASDVLYTVHCFLLSTSLMGLFSPEQRLAVLVGAAMHDFKHPGFTNNFEIVSRSELALVYNDRSVYESMHVSESFRLLRANDGALDIFDTLTPAQYKAVRESIVRSVLATDMTSHFPTLGDFEGKVVPLIQHHRHGAAAPPPPAGSPPTLSSTARATSSSLPATPGAAELLARERELILALKPHAPLILDLVLHSADISNPVKPLPVYRQWAERVINEFFLVGDRERAAGLPISAFCDRTKPALAKAQVGFIDFIVKPLFDQWGKLLEDLQGEFTQNLSTNRAHYARLKEEEERDAALRA